MCSISPPEEFRRERDEETWVLKDETKVSIGLDEGFDWSQQTSFPYVQGNDQMNRLEGPVKQFISYNVTVQNSCGQSVCVSYDQSVAGALGMLYGPSDLLRRYEQIELEWKDMHPFREDPIRDSDLRYDERKKFWRTPT